MKIEFDNQALQMLGAMALKKKLKIESYANRVLNLSPYINLAFDNAETLSLGEQETLLKAFLLAGETAKTVCVKHNLTLPTNSKEE